MMHRIYHEICFMNTIVIYGNFFLQAMVDRIVIAIRVILMVVLIWLLLLVRHMEVKINVNLSRFKTVENVISIDWLML